jgi:hypothetical protein
MPVYVYCDPTGEKEMDRVRDAEAYGLQLAHLGKTANQLLSEHLSEIEVTTQNDCCAR